MEITDVELIKKEIGNKVKWVTHLLPEGLDGTEDGILEEVLSEWETTADTSKCIDYKCQIKVEKNNRTCIIFSNRIFSIDTKNEDIQNVGINDKIAEYQAKIDALESRKKVSNGRA